MRRIRKQQVQLGEVDIAKMDFDIYCRDDIPKILIGLKYIYATQTVRKSVFDILMKLLPEGVSCNNGRPGMDLWKVFVLGTLRLNLNCDYDRIQDLANNHQLVRLMLGESVCGERNTYRLQTIKDNVSLFTPDILDEINRVVVPAGHTLVGANPDTALRGRCDSFVVETNVHYPTDINLLFDAVSKVIVLTARTCNKYGFPDWQHSGDDMKRAKSLFRRAQKLKASTRKDPDRKEKQQQAIVEAHKAYIDVVGSFLQKAADTKTILMHVYNALPSEFSELDRFTADAQRQIDQIRRRVLNGETIPHDEKVFSLFQRHTEWISKGKAGVPVELGLRICVVEDQYGFILHHEVMQKATDDKVAVSIVEATIERFPKFLICSFDKGFYTLKNRAELDQKMDFLVLPKKGKLSKKDQEVEGSDLFQELRRKHSAVESGINALEVHGLDVCPDHGVTGFKRYAALAVVARNIQQIGEIIRRRELKLEREQRKRRLAA